MNAQPIPSLHFESATLPADQQFAAQQTFMRAFAIATENPEAGFFACSTAWALGGLVVNVSNLGPIDIARDRTLIQSDSMDHYIAAVMIEGTTIGSIRQAAITVAPGMRPRISA